MSAAITSTSQETGPNPTPSRNRKPKGHPRGEFSAPSAPAGPSTAREQPRWQRRPAAETGDRSMQNAGPVRGAGVDAVNTNGSGSPSQSRSGSRPPRRRHRANKDAQGGQSNTAGVARAPISSSGDAGTTSEKPSAATTGKKTNRRGAKFKGSLSETTSSNAVDGKSATDSKPSDKYRVAVPKGDDLTSRLIYELSTPPFPDCLICFAPMHPAQPTWSCSPSNPVSTILDDDSEHRRAGETAQCCWTTFHLKCIRSWAAKSVKDIVEAWRARGEEREGVWRCPGCQSKRVPVPSSYWCFCGSTPEPKSSRLATPHSCANPCSRPRVCGHACPLFCHPGPCPPCQVTTSLPCHCGKDTLMFRCSSLAPSKATNRAAAELSCGKRCGRKLRCGNHECEDICHLGPCGPCNVRDLVKCYCGREEKEVPCGDGEEHQCALDDGGKETRWVGRYQCSHPCDRPFDCGIHRCAKPCHSPSPTPASCPRSPSVVAHCPCGKHSLDPSSASHFPPGTKLPRTTCTDPIPTCESICMKLLEGCDHACAVRCHTGSCPPCTIMIVRPCRCGSTTRDIPCFEARSSEEGGEEILCSKPCGALRACGRHQCNRLCCPLATVANATKGKGKGKKYAQDSRILDEAGWHECDLPCGKLLACGNHYCELRDHRGACPSCLRSSFEEMICNCGHTILEPPIPCGTRINCHFPCARPPLPCGHPKAQHACHEDPMPCPPCPFLASKRCACGKKTVDNVRCSQEKVSCGTPCGKLLSCGFHHCERLCHGDECGPCHATCGKPRKLCLPALHPCAHPCHAPAACDESEPCRAIIHISCPCGRIRQPIACGRSMSNTAGREGSQSLKCSNECMVAKRNARLAEALGINPDKTGPAKEVVYSDELLTIARREPKFCQMVEKSFADFLSSEKKSQVLAHMPEPRRKFVQALAGIYRLDSQIVDQEPNRSVQLIRRIDTRTPTPLLSVAAAAAPTTSMPTHNLGKLTDLRSPGSGLQPLNRPKAIPAPVSTPAPVWSASAGSSSVGGWRAVVTGQTPQSQRRPANAWGSPTSSASRPPSRPTAPATPLRVSPTPAASSTSVQAPADVPNDWEDDV
ncbi:uncharacterized protein C8Q71DRAFT_811773 [Rhodofomes roseus]|uniref:R3H domain-containing protein n=2 Tax=Rhodofomes roseus TaxID=34475 RepID=A0ABQ8KCD8_9APHY|nr:uncharacterized protein C8Q71DRAFT_811773 [Rhodofomes roseus]KAH9835226.1 hypothetical protein C8Q71DRAFT_811773 [Rhodofomes roseus]